MAYYSKGMEIGIGLCMFCTFFIIFALVVGGSFYYSANNRPSKDK